MNTKELGAAEYRHFANEYRDVAREIGEGELHEAAKVVAERYETLAKALDDLVAVKVGLQVRRRNSNEARPD